MKCNLHSKTSLGRGYNVVSGILEQLIAEFCQEYDIKATNTFKKYLSDYHRGLPYLIKWAKSLGWKVELWSLPDFGDGTGSAAFGLDFDDSCLLFMEARLKYS